MMPVDPKKPVKQYIDSAISEEALIISMREDGYSPSEVDKAIDEWEEVQKKKEQSKSTSVSSTVKASTASSSTTVPPRAARLQSSDSDTRWSSEGEVRKRDVSSLGGALGTLQERVDQRSNQISRTLGGEINAMSPEWNMFTQQQQELAGLDYMAGSQQRLGELAKTNASMIQPVIDDVVKNYEGLNDEQISQKVTYENSEEVNKLSETLYGKPIFTQNEEGNLEVNNTTLVNFILESSQLQEEKRREVVKISKEWEGDENWLGVSISAQNLANSFYGLFDADKAKYNSEQIQLQSQAYDEIVGIKPLFDKDGNQLGISEIWSSNEVYDSNGDLVSKETANDMAFDMVTKGVLENSTQIGLTVASMFVGGGAGMLLTRGGTTAARVAGIRSGITVGTEVGSGLLGLSAAGSDWIDTYGNPEMGYGERLLSATSKGVAEYLTEKIFSGSEKELAAGLISNTAEGVIENGIVKSFKKLASSEVGEKLVKAGLAIPKGMAEEGVEEAIATVAGQVTDALIQGKEGSIFEIVDAAIVGAASGGGMSSVTATKHLLSAGSSAIGWKDLTTFSSAKLVAQKQMLTDELLLETNPIRVAQINKLVEAIDMQIEEKTEKRRQFYEAFSEEDAKSALSLAGKMRGLAMEIGEAKKRYDSSGQVENNWEVVNKTKEFQELVTQWNEMHSKYDTQTEQQVSGAEQVGSNQATQSNRVVKEDTEVAFGTNTSITLNTEEDVDSQLSNENLDEKSKSIFGAVKNAISSLKSIGKDANITIHKSLSSYASALGVGLDVVENSRGVYNGKDGSVHVYMPLAKNNTTYHEVLHKISENLDPTAKRRLIKLVKDSVSKDSLLSSRYAKFLSEYEGKSKEEIEDELYTEVMSDIAAGNVSIEFVKAGAVAQIIENIAKTLNIKVDKLSNEEFIGIMSGLATGLGKGKDISTPYDRLKDAGYLTSQDISAEEMSSRLNEEESSSATEEDIKHSLAPHEEVLSRDFKVFGFEEILKQYGGRFALINSDPTGYKSTTINGVLRYLMGGIGYTFAKKNVDDGVGFASTQLSKVIPAMFAAYRIGKGKNVPMLVVTNSMKSLLGNYYAFAYFLDAMKTSIKDGNMNVTQFKQAINEVLDSMAALEEKGVKVFRKDHIEIAKKKFMSVNYNKVDEAFLAIEKMVEENPNVYSFLFRNKLIERMLSETKSQIVKSGFSKTGLYENLSEEFLSDAMKSVHEKGFLGNLLNKDGSPNASFFEKNGGLIQTGFILDFENEGSVNNKIAKLFDEYISEVGEDWALNTKKAKELKDKIFAEYTKMTEGKGIKHPQFNSKFMGSSPFILKNSIYLNNTYEEHPVLKDVIKTQTGKTPQNFKNIAGLAGGVSQSIYFFSEGFDTSVLTDDTFKESKLTSTDKLIEFFDSYSISVEQTEDGLKFQKVSPTYIFEGSKAWKDAIDFMESKDREIRLSGDPLASVYINGKVVGVVSRKQNISSSQYGDIFQYSFDIEVDKNHQRKGIASALINEAIDEFSQIEAEIGDMYDEFQYDIYIVNENMERLLREKFSFLTRPLGAAAWKASERETNFRFQNSGIVSDLVLMMKNGMNKDSIVGFLMQFNNMLKEDAEFLYETAYAAKNRVPVPIQTVNDYTKKNAWKYSFADKKAQEIIKNSIALVQRFANNEITAVELRGLFTDMLMFATDNKVKKTQIDTLWKVLTRGLNFNDMNDAIKRNFVANIANTFAYIAEQTNQNNNNPIAQHIKNIDKAKSLQSKLKAKNRTLRRSKIPFLFTYSEFIDKMGAINVMYLSVDTLGKFVDDLLTLDASTDKIRYKRVKNESTDENGKKVVSYTYEVSKPYEDYVDNSGNKIKLDTRKGKYYFQHRYDAYISNETQNRQFEFFQEAEQIAKDTGVDVITAFYKLMSKAGITRKDRVKEDLQQIADKNDLDLTTLEGYMAALDLISEKQAERLEEKRQALIESVQSNFHSFQPLLIGNKYFQRIFNVNWNDVSRPYIDTWHGTTSLRERINDRLQKLSTSSLAAIDFAIADYVMSGSQAKLDEISQRILAHVNGQEALDKMDVKATSFRNWYKEGRKVFGKFKNKHTLMRSFFRNYDTSKINKILSILGVQDLEIQVTLADMMYQSQKKSVENIIDRVKEEYDVDFNTVKYNSIAQMYTVLKQIPEGMDEMQWFTMVYNAFNKSLEFYNSDKYDGHQYSRKQLDELQDAFNFVFAVPKGFAESDNAYQKAILHAESHKLGAIKDYVFSVSRVQNSMTEALANYSEVVLGRKFKSMENYTPFRFFRKGANQDLLAMMDSSDMLNKTIKAVALSQVDREPGAVYDRQDYSFMTSDLIADFNFKGINLNTLKETGLAVSLGAKLAYVDQITKEPKIGESNAFSRLMPEAQMRSEFRRAWIRYVVNSISKQDELVPVKGAIRNSLNYLRDVTAIKFFGGFVYQILKQSPVMLSSMSKMSPQAMMHSMRYAGILAANTFSKEKEQGIYLPEAEMQLIKNSQVFLRDIDEGFFNPFGVDYDSKIKSGGKTLFEKGKEASLFTLRQTDKVAAVSSWLGFYVDYLVREGIVDSFDEIDMSKEANNPNKDAIGYANALVTRDHNQSSRRDMAEGMRVMKSGFLNQFITGMIIPFASFAINKKANMAIDIAQLTSEKTEKSAKVEAMRSLMGNIAEIATFAAVSAVLIPTINEIMAKLLGDDDDEEKGTANKEKYKNFKRRFLTEGMPYIPPYPIVEEAYVATLNRLAYKMEQITEDKSWGFKDESPEDAYLRWKALNGIPQFDEKPTSRMWFSKAIGVYGETADGLIRSVSNMSSLIKDSKYTTMSGSEKYIRSNDINDVMIGNAIEMTTNLSSMLGLNAQEFTGIAKALSKSGKARSLTEYEKISESLVKEGNADAMMSKLEVLIDAENLSAMTSFEYRIKGGAEKFIIEDVVKSMPDGNRFIKDLRLLEKIEDSGRGLAVQLADILEEYDEVDRQKLANAAVIYIGAKSESKAGYMIIELQNRGY